MRALERAAEAFMRVLAKAGIVLVVLGAIAYAALWWLNRTGTFSPPAGMGPTASSPTEAARIPTPTATEKAESVGLAERGAARPQRADYPFAAGEKLEFTAGWATLVTAGKGALEVASAPEGAASSYHFVATAETVPPASYLFLLQDRFDSIADADSLASLRFEMHLREGKTERTNMVEFDQRRGQANVGGRVVPVPQGVHDTVALIYSIRAADWEKKDAATFDFFDGQKSQQLRVRVVSRKEEVAVTAGKFGAIRAEMQVWRDGQPVSDQRFDAWLSRDKRRLPLKVEASLPFGVIRVELVSVQP